jgi:Uncharacterized protein conserved in archaea, COG5399
MGNLTQKTLAVRSEMGKISSREIINGSLKEVLRKKAIEVLEEWEENSSDFIILRDTYEVRKKIPFKSDEEYEALRSYISGREGSEVVLKVPVFIISFQNEWRENDFVDKKIYLIAPYLGEEESKELIEYAEEATREISKEENEELEEE